MKFQINRQVTAINSSRVTDKDLAKAMHLGKNEAVGLDVEAIVEQVRAALSGKGAVACRRSASQNLTVSIPMKVEGSYLAKVDLSAPKATKAKQTDEEKRQALLSDLGL